MKNSGLFIAGTDTGVGKTFVSCLILELLRQKKVIMGAMKPYSCGSWSDTKKLKKSAGLSVSLSEITPVYYKKPLAPIVKYGFLNKKSYKSPAEFDRVQDQYQRWRKKVSFVLVEGVGGVLVPLQHKFNAIDMTKWFGLPCWVVARPGLGTLNHTLLTVEALKKRKIPVQRIIISGYKGQDDAERTNPKILEKVTGLPVTKIPHVKTMEGRQKALRQLNTIFKNEGLV